MKDENDKDTGKTVDACSVKKGEPAEHDEVIETLTKCLRSLFLPDKNIAIYKENERELLAMTALQFIHKLMLEGFENEFQPIAFNIVFVKQKTGGVDQAKISSTELGGEPMGRFRLDVLAGEFKSAFDRWGQKVYGVDLPDSVVGWMEKWGDNLPKPH